jgi:hypothetical protein
VELTGCRTQVDNTPSGRRIRINIRKIRDVRCSVIVVSAIHGRVMSTRRWA